jgi:ParB-like chromosome segregation protein Spo0J
MTVNKWEIKKVGIDELMVSENNPRAISNHNFQGLVNSIKRFGLVEPIVWNQQTKRIVGGHQRLRALVEIGTKEALVVVVDMNPEEELSANLTLNNPAIEGEFDSPINDLLAKLRSEEATMFKQLNLDSLQKALEKELKKTPSSIQPPEGEYKTKCPCCGNEFEVSAEDVSVEG